tara:strand:- start:1802 stop:2707 length:906 start_codon:yes stop_codon:yes gene_type:complete
MMSETQIPRINFLDLINYKKQTLHILKEALMNHGFFIIYNHGIDKKVFENAYQTSEKFFKLDQEVKNKYAFPKFAGARGYTPFGKETALGEKIPDLKEFWHHGPSVDDNYDKRVMKNIKIRELKNFNSTFDELFIALNNLGINILSSISLTLGLKKDYFYDWVVNGNSLLRLIHYPPAKNTNVYRAREHADINLITLLIGADEPGLEIKDKNDEWIPIHTNFDEIVCNIGDMMQLVTEKNLRSTNHRVIKYENQETKSRYSIPFFLHPSPNTILKSIYNNKDKGVLADEFLDERLKAIKLY